MIKICEKCGKEFETKTTGKRCTDCRDIRTCQFCGKEYRAKSRSKTCSPECSRKSIEKTKLEKYGSKNYVNHEKAKKTCLEKYGVENVSQLEFIKKQKEETSLKNYGVTYYSKTKERLEKVKQTNLNKYGVEYILQSEEKKQKVRKTMKEKYGVDYYTNRKKQKETMKEKYGKYFVNPKKAKSTCLEKYGVDNPAKSEEVQKKMKETVLEKYGVPYFCMTNDCRSKSKANSKVNQNFSKRLKENNIEFKEEFRINNYSYDFYITNENLLLEIDPAPYHNVTWHPFNKQVSKDYHINKTITAKENNYHCIHIWDWDNLGKIINMLKSKENLYARNLEIKGLDKQEANEFLNKYHLQNKCNGNIINLGLYKDNELIQLMTFGKPRYNKNYEYELLRLCTHKDYKVVGGSEKLFKFFIKTYNPKSVISYCDNSKFTGDVYKKLGFTLSSYGKPGKHWYNIMTERHITDNLLKQRGFDQLLGKEYSTFGKGVSNKELMLQHGFIEVYDCGQSTWIYKA